MARLVTLMVNRMGGEARSRWSVHNWERNRRKSDWLVVTDQNFKFK